MASPGRPREAKENSRKKADRFGWLCQSPPSLVEYYVSGTDSSSNTETFPAGAPGDVLGFQYGVQSEFFFNDGSLTVDDLLKYVPFC